MADQKHPKQPQTDYVAQAALRVTQRQSAYLSPWIQRWLDRGHDEAGVNYQRALPGVSAPGRITRRPVANLVLRLQMPELSAHSQGSRPLVDRFSTAIVQRTTPIGIGRLSQGRADPDPPAHPDLPLPGVTGGQPQAGASAFREEVSLDELAREFASDNADSIRRMPIEADDPGASGVQLADLQNAVRRARQIQQTQRTSASSTSEIRRQHAQHTAPESLSGTLEEQVRQARAELGSSDPDSLQRSVFDQIEDRIRQARERAGQQPADSVQPTQDPPPINDERIAGVAQRLRQAQQAMGDGPRQAVQRQSDEAATASGASRADQITERLRRAREGNSLDTEEAIQRTSDVTGSGEVSRAEQIAERIRRARERDSVDDSAQRSEAGPKPGERSRVAQIAERIQRARERSGSPPAPAVEDAPAESAETRPSVAREIEERIRRANAPGEQTDTVQGSSDSASGPNASVRRRRAQIEEVGIRRQPQRPTAMAPGIPPSMPATMQRTSDSTPDVAPPQPGTRADESSAPSTADAGDSENSVVAQIQRRVDEARRQQGVQRSPEPPPQAGPAASVGTAPAGTSESSAAGESRPHISDELRQRLTEARQQLVQRSMPQPSAAPPTTSDVQPQRIERPAGQGIDTSVPEESSLAPQVRRLRERTRTRTEILTPEKRLHNPEFLAEPTVPEQVQRAPSDAEMRGLSIQDTAEPAEEPAVPDESRSPGDNDVIARNVTDESTGDDVASEPAMSDETVADHTVRSTTSPETAVSTGQDFRVQRSLNDDSQQDTLHDAQEPVAPQTSDIEQHDNPAVQREVGEAEAADRSPAETRDQNNPAQTTSADVQRDPESDLAPRRSDGELSAADAPAKKNKAERVSRMADSAPTLDERDASTRRSDQTAPASVPSTHPELQRSADESVATDQPVHQALDGPDKDRAGSVREPDSRGSVTQRPIDQVQRSSAAENTPIVDNPAPEQGETDTMIQRSLDARIVDVPEPSSMEPSGPRVNTETDRAEPASLPQEEGHIQREVERDIDRPMRVPTEDALGSADDSVQRSAGSADPVVPSPKKNQPLTPPTVGNDPQPAPRTRPRGSERNDPDVRRAPQHDVPEGPLAQPALDESVQRRAEPDADVAQQTGQAGSDPETEPMTLTRADRVQASREESPRATPESVTDEPAATAPEQIRRQSDELARPSEDGSGGDTPDVSASVSPSDAESVSGGGDSTSGLSSASSQTPQGQVQRVDLGNSGAQPAPETPVREAAQRATAAQSSESSAASFPASASEQGSSTNTVQRAPDTRSGSDDGQPHDSERRATYGEPAGIEHTVSQVQRKGVPSTEPGPDDNSSPRREEQPSSGHIDRSVSAPAEAEQSALAVDNQIARIYDEQESDLDAAQTARVEPQVSPEGPAGPSGRRSTENASDPESEQKSDPSSIETVQRTVDSASSSESSRAAGPTGETPTQVPQQPDSGSISTTAQRAVARSDDVQRFEDSDQTSTPDVSAPGSAQRQATDPVRASSNAAADAIQQGAPEQGSADAPASASASHAQPIQPERLPPRHSSSREAQSHVESTVHRQTTDGPVTQSTPPEDGARIQRTPETSGAEQPPEAEFGPGERVPASPAPETTAPAAPESIQRTTDAERVDSSPDYATGDSVVQRAEAPSQPSPQTQPEAHSEVGSYDLLRSTRTDSGTATEDSTGYTASPGESTRQSAGQSSDSGSQSPSATDVRPSATVESTVQRARTDGTSTPAIPPTLGANISPPESAIQQPEFGPPSKPEVQRATRDSREGFSQVQASVPPMVPVTQRGGDMRISGIVDDVQLQRKPPRRWQPLATEQSRPIAVEAGLPNLQRTPQRRAQIDPDVQQRMYPPVPETTEVSPTVDTGGLQREAMPSAATLASPRVAPVQQGQPTTIQRSPAPKASRTSSPTSESGSSTDMPLVRPVSASQQDRVQRDPMEEEDEQIERWVGATPSGTSSRSSIQMGTNRSGEPVDAEEIGEEDPEDQGEGGESRTDLDELARQIVPMVRRMLLVERERRTSW